MRSGQPVDDSRWEDDDSRTLMGVSGNGIGGQNRSVMFTVQGVHARAWQDYVGQRMTS